MFQKDQTPSFFDVFRIGISGFVFLVIGRYVQKKLGSIVGVEPGADMKYAIKICKKNNLKLALIDRDIRITLHRFSRQFSFNEKLRLGKELLFSPFSKKKITIDISKIPEKKVISQIINELKTNYPNIYNVLIDERNKYMARKLFDILRLNPEKRILCVIGAGHEEGLKEDLKKLYYSNVSL